MKVQSTLALLILLFGAVEAHAQTAGGSLRGVVEDPHGARVPSATVDVTLPASVSRRSVVTDRRGEFRVDNLAPGEYHVIVTRLGFSEVSTNVSIAVGAVRDLTV